MVQGFTSVPFKTESAHGISQINGVAKFSAAGIVLDFESKWFGIVAGGVKEVRIALHEILDIKFKKGVFKRSGKITLRTTSFAKLAELPNTDGKMTLNVVKDDLERAEDAVLQIQKDMANQSSQLTPPPTSVGELFADDNEDETRRLQ